VAGGQQGGARATGSGRLVAVMAGGEKMEMNRMKRIVLLSKLTGEIHQRGSWTGETHLQKAVFMLEELTGVPLDFSFILYRHGPFSFDLREELNRLRADGLIMLVPQPAPYGPSFHLTDAVESLEGRFQKTLAAFAPQVSFIAGLVGSKSAAELERLGTALLLLRRSPDEDDNRLAEQLNELKPHVSVPQALDALKEMRDADRDAPKMAASATAE
jgi:uncharacterized protein YwgA